MRKLSLEERFHLFPTKVGKQRFGDLRKESNRKGVSIARIKIT